MRDDFLTITIEQHAKAATVYVAGSLSIASALRVVRTCEQLPTAIRAARLDLRGVHTQEEGALTIIATRLRDWRGHGGRLVVSFPPPGSGLPPAPPARSSGR